jgi:protein-tyrosine-phosphatase
MAEGIAKKEFSKEGANRHNVSSAGTGARDGYPASEFAVEASKQDGIDISLHRTRSLTKKMVDQADLIVVMTEDHLPAIRIVNPNALKYSCLLSDFLEDVPRNIPDPIGHGIEKYTEVYHLIKKCIKAMASKLDAFDGWK